MSSTPSTPSTPADRAVSAAKAPEGAPQESLPAILEGCRFEGLLTFRGEAWIEGEFHGEVSARGTLGLGPGARVGASVMIDELIVAGELEGDVVARERIELRSTARVKGSLEAPRIQLEDGCTLQGRCRTLQGPVSDAPPETPAQPRANGPKSA